MENKKSGKEEAREAFKKWYGGDGSKVLFGKGWDFDHIHTAFMAGRKSTKATPKKQPRKNVYPTKPKRGSKKGENKEVSFFKG